MRLKITIEQVAYGTANLLKKVEAWPRHVSKQIEDDVNEYGAHCKYTEDNTPSATSVYHIDTEIYTWDESSARTTNTYEEDTEVVDWFGNDVFIPKGTVMGIYDKVDEYIQAAIQQSTQVKRHKALKQVLA